MPIAINGSTGAITGVNTIACDGTGTITGLAVGGLPDNCVTNADIAFSTITPTKLAQPMTLVAQQNANGSAVDFTGIPSWVKRITVLLNQVSTTDVSVPLVRIAASTGFVNSGYTSGGTFLPAGAAAVYYSSVEGFVIPAASASAVHTGIIQICNVSTSFNSWAYSYSGVNTGQSASSVAGGIKALNGVLDRVRITTTNGIDLFDNGSISIMYEG
jgi:hypothetical protein